MSPHALPLKDLCIEVEDEPWTLAWQGDRVSLQPLLRIGRIPGVGHTPVQPT